MAKKQNISEIVSFLVLFAIIILSFFFFVPKVTSTLFPFRRQMIVQEFLHSTSQRQAISPQEFWKFREFYSPGYYSFVRNGLSQDSIQKTENKIGISILANPNNDIFLTFTSPHLTSIEALVTENVLRDALDLRKIDKVTLILSRPNEMICKDAKGNIYIVFLKSIDAMKTANGFFNYSDTDKTLVEGKYWLDITMLDGR